MKEPDISDTSGDEAEATPEFGLAPAMTLFPDREEGKRLTEEERAEVCELYAAGKMRVTELSEKFGVSKSAISQYLKRRGVTWASRIIDETKVEVEAALREKPPAPDPTFADKRRARIEQTREESYNAVRMMTNDGIRAIFEAKKMGAPIGTLKETIRVYRTAVAMLTEGGRFRLEMLEADKHVDEAELPQIHIRDLNADDLLPGESEDDDDDDMVEDVGSP